MSHELGPPVTGRKDLDLPGLGDLELLHMAQQFPVRMEGRAFLASQLNLAGRTGQFLVQVEGIRRPLRPRGAEGRQGKVPSRHSRWA